MDPLRPKFSGRITTMCLIQLYYILAPLSKLKSPLPFRSVSCLTHPAFPTISPAPLAIWRNVFSSP